MRRPPISYQGINDVRDEAYTCPHCGAFQVATGQACDFQAASFKVIKCMSCRDVQAFVALYATSQTGRSSQGWKAVYPGTQARPAKTFRFAPSEAATAYGEACALFAVHVGAAGAYARRALEILLDRSGYGAKSLADSIVAAKNEQDGEKKLPKRLLSKLDCIREIGNFALHVRRDGEMAIVDIDAEEVDACLETIEDLISFLFEEPNEELERTIALNVKLKAAGKKEVPLPEVPLAEEPPANKGTV